MVQISLSGLSKSFGALKIFDRLDLEIPDRDYVCLLGPSGCGKSTLMRIIAGLDEADSGEIRFDGKRVDMLSSARRDVGMAFQNYALYPHLTVEGNLRFPLNSPLHKGRYRESEIGARVSEIADLLEITPLLGRSINQLSGGQQQRVSLGRALIRRPKVLLLDEPVTHLDARLRYAMRTELKRIHSVMGTTTIHVTHDQQEALAMADQLVVLRDGRIEQVGPPIELHDHPRTSFIASFLGDPPRSIFRGRLEHEAKGAAITVGEGRLPVPESLAGRIGGFRGTAIILAVPARALQIVQEGADLTGTVRAHEMIGEAQRIVLDVAGETFSTHGSEARKVVNGDRLGFTVDLAQAQIFDPTTDLALGAFQDPSNPGGGPNTTRAREGLRVVQHQEDE
jgi:multiple sugar transport system ATP-binding protein